MNKSILFNFEVDKANNQINVKRSFNASVDLVWAAWTKAEILEQWWAPMPWKAETKLMDFREGGYWLYAMVSPEGEKHWSKVEYLFIEKEKSFKAKDGFSDENGIMNLDFPQNLWENNFSQQNEQTIVNIQLTFDKLEDLERIIEMGFKEGFTMGLNQLEEVLITLNS